MTTISIPAATGLAHDIFAGVHDKSGQPYVHHVLRVAQYVKALGGDEHAIIAALHHDSVEDDLLTYEDLRAHGFTPESIEAIDGVTRRLDASLPSGKEPYHSGLIRRSAAHPRSRLIKLADNANNSLPRRLALLTGDHASIGNTRYPRARTILLSAERTDRANGTVTNTSFPLREDEFMRYMVALDDSLGGAEVSRDV